MECKKCGQEVERVVINVVTDPGTDTPCQPLCLQCATNALVMVERERRLQFTA